MFILYVKMYKRNYAYKNVGYRKFEHVKYNNMWPQIFAFTLHDSVTENLIFLLKNISSQLYARFRLHVIRF